MKVLLKVFTVMKVPLQILVLTFTKWLLLTSMSLRMHLRYLHFAFLQSWKSKQTFFFLTPLHFHSEKKDVIKKN